METFFASIGLMRVSSPRDHSKLGRAPLPPARRWTGSAHGGPKPSDRSSPIFPLRARSIQGRCRDSLEDSAGLRALPPVSIAAVLAVVEEQPHKEVAAALGISVAAVKLRVFRALRLLRKDLEQQGITP